MSFIRKLLKQTSAQSMAEYSIIVFFSVLVALLVVYVFAASLTQFHANASSVVCLPVP